MKYTQIIHPETPGRTFILRQEHPMAVFEVLDLTSLTEEQLMKWKCIAINYATTEVAGRYYGLLLAQINKPTEDEDDDISFGPFVAKMFLEAADWWNTNALSLAN